MENPLDRIAAVLSERDAAALVAAERVQGDAALHAYVSRPDAHRATTAGIHLFVNGRPVRDRLMRHALLQVYRDLLPRGRFPTAVLFLERPHLGRRRERAPGQVGGALRRSPGDPPDGDGDGE